MGEIDLYSALEEFDNSYEQENQEEETQEEQNEEELESNQEETQDETQEETQEESENNDELIVQKPSQQELYYKRLNEQEKMLKHYEDALLPNALANGFTDVNSYLEAIKEASIKKEAETKGIPYDFYKQQMETKAQVEALQQQRYQEAMYFKATQLQSNIDSFAKENGFTGSEVLEALETSGFKDIREVMTIPNLSVVLKGAMADKITQKKAEKIVSKDNRIASLNQNRADGSTEIEKTDAELGEEDAVKALKELGLI